MSTFCRDCGKEQGVIFGCRCGTLAASVGYDFYLHEALHTAHVLICTWGEHVLESKAVTDDPELTKLAEEASTAMAKVYQAIGAKY